MQPWDWAYYAARVRGSDTPSTPKRCSRSSSWSASLRDGVFHAAYAAVRGHVRGAARPAALPPRRARLRGARRRRGRSALFLGDWYARPIKRGGAWMSGLRRTSRGCSASRPVVVVNLNIPKPPAGRADAADAWTRCAPRFHEFGHALHGLFSDVQLPALLRHGRAARLRGVPVPGQRDVGLVAGGAGHYAVHHETGEPLPADVSERLQASQVTGRASPPPSTSAAALLDQEWHHLTPARPGRTAADVEAFEPPRWTRHGLWSDARPAPVPQHLLRAHLRRRLRRRRTTPTSGARSWTPTRSTGSPSTAGCVARTATRSAASCSRAAAPSIRWRRSAPSGAARRAPSRCSGDAVCAAERRGAGGGAPALPRAPDTD